MGQTTTYDFKKVSVIVDGVIITGFMDGESIASEKNEDDVTAHVGAGGDVTFSETNDDTGTITLTLKSTSSSLPYLQSLRKAKKLFSTQVVDSNNQTYRCGGNECRIVKMPPRNWGNEVTGVEIGILVADFKEA
ncbi:DUF3277 family protein [Bacillus sp. Gen3]|uniref:phage structural protein n=1 Tax=Heyndrickxia oleronia TaxID=38875 RepID=UPI0015D3C45E|nr:phage protein [Heyndrickxia oleronia]MBU5214355.1 DUF3277 family protein [Heyndrickxia oleronia]NYV64652.1 DUF3277 family protein [Bacillus sp. Gen3]